MTDVKLNHQVITSSENLTDMLNILSKQLIVAFDVETTGFDYIRDEMHGISFATREQEWYVMGEALHNLFPKLNQVTQDKRDIRWVAHNAKFDLHFTKPHGFNPTYVFDTMIALWLLDENWKSYALKKVSNSLLGITEELLEFRDLQKLTKANNKEKFKKFAQVTIWDIDQELLTKYACKDTRLTFDVWDVLASSLHKEGLIDYFRDVEMPFMRLITKIEEAGMRVNKPLLAEYGGELREREEELKHIWDELTDSVNPSSTPQLRELLFDRLKLNTTRKTKSGAKSTDKITLMRLEKKDKTGIIRTLLDWREVSKLTGTYISAFENHHEDGRLRGSLKQTGTVTGRLASHNPNFQNIPSRGNYGGRIKELFIAEEGNMLLCPDYSQLELRIQTHYSKDPQMMELFKEGGDPHQRTADQIATDRDTAKTVNFLWSYGGGPKALCDSIEKTGLERPKLSVAKEWLRTFDVKNPMLVKLKQRIVRAARERGFVKTIAGRKRRLPNINSQDDFIRSRSERQAVNSIIQGCKEENTRVLTEQGQIKIKELDPNQHVLITHTGTTQDYVVHDTGVKETFNLSTNRGNDLVTSDHRFFVVNDSDLETRKLSELSDGDVIVAQTKLVGGEVYENYTKDQCHLLGVLSGDGWYKGRKRRGYKNGYDSFVSIALDRREDDTYKQQLLSTFASLGITPREYYRKDSNTMTYTVQNRPFREWLREAGFDNVARQDKRIPEWLFTASVDQRVGVLQGMYDSGGGIVSDRYIGYTSKNRHLAQGFTELCQSLGMLCCMITYSRNNDSPTYRCYVKDPAHVSSFLGIVGSNIKRKTQVREVIFNNSNLPKELKTSVGNLCRSIPLIDGRSIFTNHEASLIHQLTKGNNGSKRSIGLLLDKVSDYVDVSNLRNLLSLDYARIRSIKSIGSKHTYDIEVFSKEHCYISGGLLQHNSSGDIMKTVMLDLEKGLPLFGGQQINQVHDEILIECVESEAKECAEYVQEKMESMTESFALNVGLVADAHVGKSWKEAK